MDSWIFILYIGHIIHYLSCCSNCTSFGYWEVFQDGSCVPLTSTYHFGFLSTSLIPSTTRCSKLILYDPCPSPRISHFSKELSFLQNGFQFISCRY
uniref:Uncharacterized protein n=1 Tax=Rhinolophus ferrumequinum TaxID=59479 RepID=A0A671E7S4_RHIFE